MSESATILAIAGIFLIAGAVKGVIGLGLPTVSLALLAVTVDLPSAMALLLVPSFITNLWQAVAGGNAVAIMRRLWPFLLMAAAAVWPGAAALGHVDPASLLALLGGLLVVYATANLAGFRFRVASHQERLVGLLMGSVNGVLTGMTGSFVVPGVLFLQAIGLPRDMLIQAMGALFTASTLALAVALRGHGLLTTELAAWSTAALLPALIGMVVGQQIRRRLAEHLFRRVFFVSLLALGAYIIARALAD